MGAMTTTYSLTAHSKSLGWRDIQVLHASSMHEAIALAERATGCMVSHGRGGVQSDFDPGTVIDAETGEVTQLHDRKARPQVVGGPPDVMRAIAAALKAAPKAAPRRKTGRKPEEQTA